MIFSPFLLSKKHKIVVEKQTYRLIDHYSITFFGKKKGGQLQVDCRQFCHFILSLFLFFFIFYIAIMHLAVGQLR